MHPFVRSFSAVIPSVFGVLALAGAAQAQNAPTLTPAMPAAPSGPGVTPGFNGQAPNPNDPASPYYVPPAGPTVTYAQRPPPPVAAGVVAPEGGPDRGPEAPPARTGFEFGFRTGVGLPMSSAMSGYSMSSFLSTEVPIGLSFGSRFTENVYFGIYGQYAFVSTTGCGDGSCSAFDVRGGIELQYHLHPRDNADPWIGYGAGYEHLGFSADGESAHLDGFVLADLQLGIDWRIARTMTMGPFTSFAVGEYVSEGTDAGSTSVSQPTMHEWLTFGLRLQAM
jgi:hypothetical protein